MMFFKIQIFFLMILIISMSVPTTLSWLFSRRKSSCDSSSCQWRWGSCSAICGGGTQGPYITRNKGSCGRCDLPSARRCNTQCCRVDCLWGYWSPWSNCSKTCEYGTKMRSRTIVRQANCGGLSCSGSSTDSSPCNTMCCPINIRNGNSVCTNGQHVGSTCSHSCLNRYRLVGSVYSTCSRNQSTTSWSPTISSCQGFCSRISIANGRASCTNGFDVNSVCNQSCSSGYKLIGSKSLKCTEQNGSAPTWSTRIPECRGFCPTSSLTNGRSSCTNSFNVNSVCTHSCSSGYRLVGSTSSKCTERNALPPTWSTSIPRCQGFCSVKLITNGQSSCTNDNNVNSDCTYSCSSGYRLVGSASSKCIERNGSFPIWSKSIPRCRGFCPAISITNGQKTCTSDYNLNSVCSLSCSSGYKLMGSSSSKCIEQSESSPAWSPSITLCQAVCPTISIANGSTRCTGNEQINSFCIHSCLHGFPVGYRHSRCLKHKASTPQWSPPIPRCPDKLACPKLSISHATTNCTRGEDINSICRHTCSPGYIRSGVNYARCTGGVYSNPRWIPPPLPCIDKNEAKAKHQVDI